MPRLPSIIARLMPLLGWLDHRLAFRGLHTSLGVEIRVAGRFSFGAGCRVGEKTRIDVVQQGEISLGQSVNLSRHVYLRTDGGCVAVGSHTSLQDNCRLSGNVMVGQNCIFAPNVFASSGTHTFDHEPYRLIAEQERQHHVDRPVVIGDDCWLGINVAVLPGTTIGRGCIIGANAVVTCDLPPYSVAVGAPARVVKQRLEFCPPAEIIAANPHHTPYFYSGCTLIGNEKSGFAMALQPQATIALAAPPGAVIRIELEGSGSVALQGQTQTVSAITQCEFTVHEHGPWLSLKSSGDIALRWAKVIAAV